MNVRIASYNVLGGKFYAHQLRTKEIVVNLDNIVKLIQDEDIEICGLQEVYNQTFEDAPRGQQVKMIGEKLGYYHVFAKGCLRKDDITNQFGVGLVSKYPITSFYTVPIVLDPAKKTDPKMWYEDRVLLVVDLLVGGKPMTVINTHFGLAPEERALSIAAIREEMKKSKNPVVLMGDFNCLPDSQDYEDLSEIPNLNDVAALMGNKMLPNTFPSHTHTRKIDFIFVSDDFKGCIKDADVVYVTYSDHLPYTMNVEW